MPAIYTTYLSYDEVAHHAGLDTADALNTLRSLDRQIRRIRNVIRKQPAVLKTKRQLTQAKRS